MVTTGRGTATRPPPPDPDTARVGPRLPSGSSTAALSDERRPSADDDDHPNGTGNRIPGRDRCPGEYSGERGRRGLPLRRRLVPAHPRPRRRGAGADRRAGPPRRPGGAVHLRPGCLVPGPAQGRGPGPYRAHRRLPQHGSRRRLPDLGRGIATGGPAGRAPGDRRADRRASPAAVHPARAAPLAADGAGGGALDPVAAGAGVPPGRLRKGPPFASSGRDPGRATPRALRGLSRRTPSLSPLAHGEPPGGAGAPYADGEPAGRRESASAGVRPCGSSSSVAPTYSAGTWRRRRSPAATRSPRSPGASPGHSGRRTGPARRPG